jgi:hypothetical protein
MAEASNGGWSRTASAGCAIIRPTAWRKATASAGRGVTSAKQRTSASSTEITL